MFDAFIKFDGIDGESNDYRHKGWIEIDGYAFGVSQPYTASGSSVGSLGAARTDIHNFTFTHKLDLSSPQLFEACCRGLSIRRAVIHLNRATGDKSLYMEYKLTKVFVTSVAKVGNSNSESDVPMEWVSVAMGKVEMDYIPYDLAGKGPRFLGSWNLETNTKA